MIHLYVYCIIYTVSQKLCTSPASCCHLRTVEKWRKVEATTRSFRLYMTSSSLGERGSSRKIPWISFGTQTMLTLPSFAVGNTNLHEFSSQKCVFFFFPGWTIVVYTAYIYCMITYLYTNYNKVSKLPAPAANCLIFWDWRNRPLTDRDVW